MNPAIQIFCGRMNVFHEKRGLMLTSDVQDPPARWETTGPDGQPLGGPITFPATYVREENLVTWWVDECEADGAIGVFNYNQIKIVSRLPKERCDFVLWCEDCFASVISDGNTCSKCGGTCVIMPHVIARAILAPTTIRIPGYVGEVWQPEEVCGEDLAERAISRIVLPFAGQQGIVYPDCPGYFTGIGRVTMQPIAATGEVRWTKADSQTT